MHKRNYPFHFPVEGLYEFSEWCWKQIHSLQLSHCECALPMAIIRGAGSESHQILWSALIRSLLCVLVEFIYWGFGLCLNCVLGMAGVATTFYFPQFLTLNSFLNFYFWSPTLWCSPKYLNNYRTDWHAICDTHKSHCGDTPLNLNHYILGKGLV